MMTFLGKMLYLKYRKGLKPTETKVNVEFLIYIKLGHTLF